MRGLATCLIVIALATAGGAWAQAAEETAAGRSGTQVPAASAEEPAQAGAVS